MHSPCQSYFLSVWRVADGLVVHPIGSLPLHGRWLADAKILGLVEQSGPGRLYLDLRRTPLILQPALRGLLIVLLRATALGGRVVLCGHDSALEEIFQITGGRRNWFPDFSKEGPPVSGHTLLDPSWLAWNYGAVRMLAQTIYDDRTFDRLPILADALEDSGCTDADILAHCRTAGEHMRECWVLDLLRGRT